MELIADDARQRGTDEDTFERFLRKDGDEQVNLMYGLVHKRPLVHHFVRHDAVTQVVVGIDLI